MFFYHRILLFWRCLVKQDSDNTSCIFGSYRWFPFAKGGKYSPYYANIHLVLNWENDGEEIKVFTGSVIRNPSYYFHPGITWPRRTTSGISVRVLPKGCIFADKAPAVFTNTSQLAPFLGLMNSQTFETLIALRLSAADAAARSYEVGIIQDTPVPEISSLEANKLGLLASNAFNIKLILDRINETSHVFHIPAILQTSSNNLNDKITAWQKKINQTDEHLSEYQCQIYEIAFKLYRVSKQDRKVIETTIKGQ